MRKLSRRLQLIVAAASVAIVLAIAVVPSLTPHNDAELASRYPQRGRVARFYGRNAQPYGRSAQRSVTAPPQTVRQVQWSRGIAPLGW